MCGNKIIHEKLSPDQDFKAVVFERDCGATTAFSTQISLLEASESLSGGGNAFVSDGGQIVEGLNGPWVEIRWLGPSSLEVRYDASARLFEQDENVQSTRISYVPVKLATQ